MTRNEHFVRLTTWADAAEWIDFEPRVPRFSAACALTSLSVFVRDHKLRDVANSERSLEAHYGRFVLAQSRPGVDEAKSQALETRYGRDPVPVNVAGREGRAFALGPEPAPDDIDRRPPAVVTWAEGARFFLVASDELEVEVLMGIAESLYQGVEGEEGEG